MPKIPELISDFYTDTPDRIIGTETEYSIQRRHLLSLGYISAIDPYAFRMNPYERHVWLSDGSKLYIDFAHDEDDAPDEFHESSDGVMEFATAECLSATDAVRREKAGEYLMQKIGEELVPKGVRYPVFKRTAFESIIRQNGDVYMSAGSLGHHENYTTPVFVDEAREGLASKQFISYLATRPIWAGAGIVTMRGYHLAQKVDGVYYSQWGTDMVTHGTKMPIMRHYVDRGEPSIEVRSGDGNMSPWAIRTKLAMTSLVLRLIEHGVFPMSSTIEDGNLQPLASHGSRHPNISLALGLFEGSAVDHQAGIAQAALNFALTHDVPEEELTAVVDILATCHDIREWGKDPDALELLADRVDWAAKLSVIQRRLGVHAKKLTAFNLDAVKIDLLWEALGPHSISSKYYAARGNVVAEHELTKVLMTPPETRAKTRVDTIRASKGHGLRHVDWQSFSYADPRNDFMMTDPYLRTGN